MTGEPRCAVGVPNVGLFGDPLLLVELAVAAEQHGWDGFFVWDHLRYPAPVRDILDPYVCLAVMAARTSRITLGPMVTPSPATSRESVFSAPSRPARNALDSAKFGIGVFTADEDRLTMRPQRRPRIAGSTP